MKYMEDEMDKVQNSSRGLVRLEAGERMGLSRERMVQEFRNGWEWYICAGVRKGLGRGWIRTG